MKTVLVGVFVLGLLVTGLGGGWVAMNYYNPGSVGTPAHAGAVSNGQPLQCTNLNFNVKARSSVEKTARFEAGGLVRGTFEAQGGLGRVDILLRVRDPQNLEILASPKTDNYDFTFPVPIRGDYTFVFDNRYSMYTSKSVGLFYCIDPSNVPAVRPFAPQPTQ